MRCVEPWLLVSCAMAAAGIRQLDCDVRMAEEAEVNVLVPPVVNAVNALQVVIATLGMGLRGRSVFADSVGSCCANGMHRCGDGERCCGRQAQRADAQTPVQALRTCLHSLEVFVLW